jgi:hypothetical protein
MSSFNCSWPPDNAQLDDAQLDNLDQDNSSNADTNCDSKPNVLNNIALPIPNNMPLPLEDFYTT